MQNGNLRQTLLTEMELLMEFGLNTYSSIFRSYQKIINILFLSYRGNNLPLPRIYFYLNMCFF